MNKKTNILLNSLNSTMGKTKNRYTRWAKKHNVNPYVSDVLYIMKTSSVSRQKEIVENTGIPKQTVSCAISELVRNGYATLETDRNDKRSKIIKLTASGEEYSEKVAGEIVAMEKEVIEEMGAQCMQNLIDLLDEFDVLLKKKMKAKYETDSELKENNDDKNI